MEFVDENQDPHRLHARLVPFIGSAVSMFHPTSLPNWSMFIETIKEALEETAGTTLEIPGGGSPQGFTEIVSRRLGKRYLDVLKGLLDRPPNQVHEALVANIKAGKYPAIVTTNFDRVLEDLMTVQGVGWCHLRGRDEGKDRAALGTLLASGTSEETKVVVVTDPRSFAALESMPGLLANPRVCFLLKIHGDAGFPETCVDNELQRERGLPASVRTILSAFLKRYPLFFMGWGGGDMDHNGDYVRLQSEADTATVYWLLRPNEPEPSAFATIRTAFGKVSRAEEFRVVRGSLVGEFRTDGPSAFRPPTLRWASALGSDWCRLALGDLSAPPATVEDTRHRLALVPLAGASAFTVKSVQLSRHVVDAVESLLGDDLDAAWSHAIAAIGIARQVDPGYHGRWVAYAAVALVLSRWGDSELALAFLRDAQSVARGAGNSEVVGWLSESRLKRMLHREVNEEIFKSERQFAEEEEEAAQPLQVFSQSFDNVKQSDASGLPDDTLIRGELYRAILVGDLVAVPQTALLNSRVFVQEVLFDADQRVRTELVRLIRPMLDNKHRESERPLVAARADMVSNPRFMQEEIRPELVESIQRVFAEDSTSHDPLFVDYKPISANYENRTKAMLQDAKSAEYALPRKHHKAANVKRVVEATTRFVEAVTSGANKRGLLRSDMYAWADLFLDRHTSDQEVWKRVASPEVFGDEAAMAESRAAVLEAPWWSAALLKRLSDAAYTTNLPLHLQLSFTIGDESRDTVPLLMLRSILAKEPKQTAAIADDSLQDSQVELESLAALTFAQVLQLRNSPEAKAFRAAARKVRDAPGSDRKAFANARKSSKRFSVRLAKIMTDPMGRSLPKSPVRDPDQVCELDRDLCTQILQSLVPAYAMPPPSLYDVSRIPFPGLLIVGQPRKQEQNGGSMSSVAPAVLDKGDVVTDSSCECCVLQ